MNYLAILPLLSFTSYAVATFLLLQYFFNNTKLNTNFIFVFSVLALLAHAGVNAQIIWIHNDIDFSLPNVVALVSFIITLVTSLLALKNQVSLILPITYAFSGLWLVVMFSIPSEEALLIDSGRFFLTAHIILALIAYCILVIATLYAFQIAYINVKLKNKDIASIEHLPPIMLIEKQLLRIIIWGVAFLTASEILGFMFFENIFAPQFIHKTVLSLFALAGYILILWGKLTLGWRGIKLMVLLLISTGILSLAYFGSRFIREYLIG